MTTRLRPSQGGAASTQANDRRFSVFDHSSAYRQLSPPKQHVRDLRTTWRSVLVSEVGRYFHFDPQIAHDVACDKGENAAISSQLRREVKACFWNVEVLLIKSSRLTARLHSTGSGSRWMRHRWKGDLPRQGGAKR